MCPNLGTHPQNGRTIQVNQTQTIHVWPITYIGVVSEVNGGIYSIHGCSGKQVFGSPGFDHTQRHAFRSTADPGRLAVGEGHHDLC